MPTYYSVDERAGVKIVRRVDREAFDEVKGVICSFYFKWSKNGIQLWPRPAHNTQAVSSTLSRSFAMIPKELHFCARLPMT